MEGVQQRYLSPYMVSLVLDLRLLIDYGLNIHSMSRKQASDSHRINKQFLYDNK